MLTRLKTTLSQTLSGNVSSSDDDVEAHIPLAENFGLLTCRLAKSIFGLESDEVRSKWPGLDSYARYVQAQFDGIGSQVPLALALRGDAETEDEVHPGELMLFIAELADIIKGSDENVSLHELVSRWLQSKDRDTPKSASKEMEALYQVGFCAICWITMAAEPATSPRTGHLEVAFPDGCTEFTSCQRIANARRPLQSIIREIFRDGLVPGMAPQSASQGSDLIHISCVNYAMLREFGKVAIEWTDILSCHLLFLEHTRTLFLFRLPTVCAVGCAGGGSEYASDRILKGYYETSSQTRKLWLRLRQEVILSYRILFGQDKSSRKLFNDIYRQAASINNGISHPLSDPLLSTLCTQQLRSESIQSLPAHVWPQGCKDLDNSLREYDEYSASGEMPLLGPRLLALQEFNNRQRPRNFWSLWKDKRDKPKWYTFWVVLIVGGLALVLAVIQTALSIAQLGVAVKELDVSST